MNELKHYVCHKKVHARPMKLGDYRHYMHLSLGVGENPDEEGYFVIYDKDTPDHYASWSPKKQFDKGYTELAE